MKLPHDKFCILPWVSLEASPIGTVRPCCLAKEEITDESGNQYRLASTSFDAIRNSSYMQKLRSEFIEGKLPSRVSVVGQLKTQEEQVNDNTPLPDLNM